MYFCQNIFSFLSRKKNIKRDFIIIYPFPIMSTKTENYMSIDNSHIIHYTEKGISIASIIFSL